MTNEELFGKKTLELCQKIADLSKKYDHGTRYSTSLAYFCAQLVLMIQNADDEKKLKLHLVQTTIEKIVNEAKKEWQMKYKEDLHIKIGCADCTKWGTEIK